MRRCALLVLVLAGAAHGEPGRSSRLFAMPIADTVGPYRLTLSEDGSLLQEQGVLSSAGVLAIGFGDLAQLEYRHTSAISIGHTTAPVPAIGVQLKLPLPDRPTWPGVAVAFRLGVPRRETFGATTVDETVTDLYVVARMRLGASWTLHGGVRFSSAAIAVGGDRDLAAKRGLVLPATGFEVTMNPRARLVGEIALAPRFAFDPSAPGSKPAIGTGVLGRFGVRWSVWPALTLDASLGYQLEVAGSMPADGLASIVQWDIRLGGEVYVNWGALSCRALRIFCQR